MKKSLVSMLILFFIGLQGVLAQGREISGVVTSADDGLSLPGVSVIVKGTTIGTSTNYDGKYSLNVPEGETVLVFSFMGMTTKEMTITGSTLNVVMDSESIGMDEVIVTAYGASTKASFTGSVSVVKEEAMREASTISAVKALQGKAAGVVVSQSAGQPGSAPTIRIRGVGSINGNKSPLYVIDGVPVLTGDYTTGQTSASVMNMINPEDIASQSILKDAAATALYGSRGANGVILITTKSGIAGKTKVSISVEKGVSELANPSAFDYMNAKDYAAYSHEALTNYYLNANDALPGGANAGDYDDLYDDATNWAYSNLYGVSKLYHPDDNFDGTFDYGNMTIDQAKKYLTDGKTNKWDDEIFRTGSTEKYDISIRGGNDKTKFYTSLGYLNQEGVTIGSAYERYSGTMNLKTKVTDAISFSISEKFTHGVQEGNTSGGWYYQNPIFGLYNMNPSSPTHLADGSPNPNPGFAAKTSNPAEVLDKNTSTNKTTRSITNAKVNVKFTDYLSFETTNAVDFIFSSDRNLTDPRTKEGSSYNGRVSRSKRDVWNLTTSNLLKFSKTVADNHNVGLLAGYEYKVTKDNRFSAYSDNYASYKLLYLSNGAEVKSASEYETEDKLISYFSKADYNYDNKYFFSASFRRDGSSRLAKDVRWGDFYSGSLGWVVTKEDFMSSIDYVDFLKLKASYGVTGNLPTALYGSQALYSVSGKYQANPVLTLSQMENSQLEWEKSYTWNVGFDFGFFDIVRGSFEYYNKKTDGLINNTPLLWATGFDEYTENKGVLRNKGFEIELSWDNFKEGDFKWSTDFNIAYMSAKIEKIESPVDDFPYYYGEGDDLYSFRLREWAGVDKETGKPLWVKNTELEDGSRDRELTSDPSEATKVIVGKGTPDYYGGMTNRLSYKNFDLSFLLTYRLGGELYDSQHSSFSDGSNIGKYNIRKSSLNKHWRKPGDNAEFTRLIYNAPDHANYNSSRRLVSADYLKLKNLSIGYNLPKHLISKAKLEKVRIYVNATDLLTFAAEDYIDPEVGLDGYVEGVGSYPSLKTYRVGVNIQF